MRLERRILAIAGILAFASLTAGSGIAVADDDDDGGSQVTSSGGSVAVPGAVGGTTGAAGRLPLTRVTVSGRCELSPPLPPPIPPSAVARGLVQAEQGRTMDAFSPQGSFGGPPTGTIGGQTLLTTPLAAGTIGGIATPFGTTQMIVTSNRSTATITMGATIDLSTGVCTFLWQAIESRNS